MLEEKRYRKKNTNEVENRETASEGGKSGVGVVGVEWRSVGACKRIIYSMARVWHAGSCKVMVVAAAADAIGTPA